MRDIRNAADSGQVKNVEDRARRQRESELNDVRHLLSTKAGRRFVWRILDHCRVFASIWENSAKIHYNSGVQDAGRWVLEELAEADPEAFANLLKESAKGELVNE